MNKKTTMINSFLRGISLIFFISLMCSCDEIAKKLGYEKIEREEDNIEMTEPSNNIIQNSSPIPNSTITPQNKKYQVTAKMYYYVNDYQGGYLKDSKKFVTFEVWVDNNGYVWSDYGPVRVSSLIKEYSYECNTKDRLFVFDCDYIY